MSKNRDKLIEMLDEGFLDPKQLAKDLLGYLSDDDCKEFAEKNDIELFPQEDDEGETLTIVAGWNMPGYMPDNPPEEFDNWDDAQMYISDAIDEQADSIEEENPDLADKLRGDAILVLKMPNGDFGATLAGTYYFITMKGD